MTVVEREIAREVEFVTEREQRARVLEAAALEIDVRGWTQGDYDDRGRVCLMAGIACAKGEDPFMWPYQRTVWGGVGDVDEDLLWMFNDHTAESADDVKFVLRWRAEEIRDGR